MSTRADRLTALLPDAGLDLLLVTDLINVRYLTGYTGSNGLALIGPETRLFVTDFRYVEQAAAEVSSEFDRHRAPNDLIKTLTKLLPDDGVRLGFEDAHLSVRQHARLRSLLRDEVELIAAGSLVEELRAVKDPGEIAAIRAAAELADRAFEELISRGLVGRTEREVAIALEREMIEQGARGPSFETIVAAGAQGALPHAQRRDVEIRAGDLVVVDWGAELDGYCSDCTRTVAAAEASGEAREVYALVLSAQLAGLEAIRAGAGTRAVDAAARAVIDAAGHGEEFGHGLGHGVGLDIHEAPRLSQHADGTLVAGNVVTVEPGVYLAGRFGVRIEDLVVVTDVGCEIVTSVPKELRIAD